MVDGERFSQLVVVGSSAGGIEALSRLVSTLPSDFPAPIVIAQHLDPKRASHLGSILGQHSTLPVRTVIDGREDLEPGVVYVVPANRNVQISNHEVRLLESPRGPKPSIDLLLRSAAGIFGEDLIAVILTGTGSDGAAGAVEVKREGGTVVIQNPRTAPYPALPLSLSPATVDIVADIEEIGPLLHTLLTGTLAPATSGDEAALQALLTQLQERHDVDFSSYKQPTIMRRLQRRIAATGTTSIQGYIRYLAEHPDEYRQLISSFLIKVTEFFRDPELYQHLREEIVPALIADARARGNRLRVWSAGCATGEEAYSLAILVADALGMELDQFHVRIFATDLDAEAIDFARRGIYPSSTVRDVPEKLLQKYFVPIDNEYQVRKSVRNLMVFGHHDLAERAPFPHIDLLVCRNVLIYFGSELQRHVLQLFAFSLRDGGYLVLGKAEAVTPAAEYFSIDNPRLKIFRRRGDRALIPSPRIKDTLRTASPPPLAALGPTPMSESLAARTAREERGAVPHETWYQSLLQLPVGFVVIDRQYDIQLINSAARQLLDIYGPAIGQDFVHLAQHVPPRELRSAIDAAFRDQEPVRLGEIPTLRTPGGPEQYLQIFIKLYQREGEESHRQYAIVTIEDVSEQVEKRLAAEQARDEQRGELERMRAQLQELTSVDGELRRANEELTTANMELRGANEEFLVGNEELQAAAEEVETLNEELQATNEELETLNEELQATVEELNATNDDLQARSIELQDLTVSIEGERRASETERSRLAAILSSMGDPVLVVDTTGKTVLTNEAFDTLFGSDERDLVARDERGEPLSSDETPQARAARGQSFNTKFRVRRPDGSYISLEINGRPIHTNGELEGAVLVIRDVTDRPPRAE